MKRLLLYILFFMAGQQALAVDFTCPSAASIRIIDADPFYNWVGPFVVGFGEEPQPLYPLNSSKVLGEANRLIYEANRLICYYPANGTLPAVGGLKLGFLQYPAPINHDQCTVTGVSAHCE